MDRLLFKVILPLLVVFAALAFVAVRWWHAVTAPIEMLSKAEWDRCERTCQAETGYHPEPSSGVKNGCYALIKVHLDQEFRKNNRYPQSIDSVLDREDVACYPLGKDAGIAYSYKGDGGDFTLDALNKRGLDSVYAAILDSRKNTPEITTKYRVCMTREAKSRWQERKSRP